MMHWTDKLEKLPMKKLPMKILAAIALTLALAAHAAILPLHDAARRNDAAAIAELLDAGINPNMKDSQRYTALYIATDLGHIEAIVALLKGGANPNAVSGRYFYSPLHAAARRGHVKAIVALLDAGADPNAAHRGYFPLHAAAGHGHVEAILTLLDAGADPNENRGRLTPPARGDPGRQSRGHGRTAQPLDMALGRPRRPEFRERLRNNPPGVRGQAGRRGGHPHPARGRRDPI